MCDEARRIIEGDLGPGQGPTKIMRAALPLSFGVRENWRSSHLFWTIRLSRLAARPLPSPRVFVRDHGRKDCRQAVVVLCHSGQTPPRCRRAVHPNSNHRGRSRFRIAGFAASRNHNSGLLGVSRELVQQNLRLLAADEFGLARILSMTKVRSTQAHSAYTSPRA
jgi:hypothetical protein